MDPADSLIAAGDDGVQLTWMDAKVDDWVVTPRRGKPVEVNALWYNALAAMVTFANRLKRPAEAHEQRMREIEMSFQRFWNPETGCLFDVLDGPEGNDPAIRPNQLLAVSLPASPLTARAAARGARDLRAQLLTSHGLRSLAPGDSRYHGVYTGDRRQRDGAYHQGTVWTWLLPHFALAHARVHGRREEALAFLEPLGELMGACGVGSLPEVADGDGAVHPARLHRAGLVGGGDAARLARARDGARRAGEGRPDPGGAHEAARADDGAPRTAARAPVGPRRARRSTAGRSARAGPLSSRADGDGGRAGARPRHQAPPASVARLSDARARDSGP